MQKRILAIVLFLIGVNLVFAQETYIPDDNFENYLETHDKFGNLVPVGSADSMGDGYLNNNTIKTSRIYGVTELHMTGIGISDLRGIEAFTSLTFLKLLWR